MSTAATYPAKHIEDLFFLKLARMQFGDWFNIPERPKNCTKAQLIEMIKVYQENNYGIFLNPQETQVLKPFPKEWKGYHAPEGATRFKSKKEQVNN